MSKANAWYIRANNQVKGPFPAGQISQSLILGRYNLQHEVSLDREEWQPIARVPELIPDVLKGNPNDPEHMERLKAARRWADERRHDSGVTSEHRKSEDYESREYRDNREHVYEGIKKKNDWAIVQILTVVCIVLGVLFFSFVYGERKIVKVVDCAAPASQGVNWQFCRLPGKQLIKTNLQQANLNTTVLSGANLFASDLSGANMSYADLSQANLSFVNFTGANLKGANLQRSDLSKATFNEADLSYADLRGATLSDVKFNNTKLDNAIWTDGRTCAVGSVDECAVVEQ